MNSMSGFMINFNVNITQIITISIAAYFAIMLIITAFIRRSFNKKNEFLQKNDTILGDRKLKTLQTAMSVAAADTSSWVMIALPASVYVLGLSQAMIPIGLLIGSYLSWKFVAVRLRQKTEECNAFTLPSYLQKCCDGTDNKLQIKKHNVERLSSIVILFFLVVYISSGIKSAGILVQSFTNIDYRIAIAGISIFISLYTVIGNIKGISWGDVFQTFLIILSLIALPLAMYNECCQNNSLKNFFLDELFDIKDTSIICVISSLSWGLGYFGEPHILSKFMASKSEIHIKKASIICIIWTFTAFFCAVLIGIFGKKLWSIDKPEMLFFTAVFHYYDNYIIGIFFASVIAAILSTICSQLIVCSGILIKNTSFKVFLSYSKQNYKPNQQFLNFVFILLLSFVSFCIAYDESSKIMSIVQYAWGGLGASFGPVVLYSLYAKNTYNSAIFYGIVFGFIFIVAFGGLHYYSVLLELYEILPAFLLSSTAIYINHHKVSKMKII